MGKQSSPEIAEANGVHLGAVNRILAELMSKTLKTPAIHGFEKRTAYDTEYIDEHGFLITVEMQMLSCPYYNPEDLEGWEYEQLTKHN